jgi:hypothetical protein
MIREYSLMLVIVLVLVQNLNCMNITYKNLRNSSNINFAQTEMQAVPEGSWFLIKNSGSNMCLTWTSGKTIKQALCNSKQLNQIWKVQKNEKKEGGWVHISNINGEFLENAGRNYKISDKNETGSQVFLATDRDSGLNLKNESSKKCLAPSDLNDGSLVKHMACCDKAINQWKFEKVDFNPLTKK